MVYIYIWGENPSIYLYNVVHLIYVNVIRWYFMIFHWTASNQAYDYYHCNMLRPVADWDKPSSAISGCLRTVSTWVVLKIFKIADLNGSKFKSIDDICPIVSDHTQSFNSIWHPQMGKTHMGGLPEGPASQIILFGLLAWGIPHFETHPDGSEHGEYLKIAILQREDHIWSKNIGNILHIKPNPYGGFVKWRYPQIIHL